MSRTSELIDGLSELHLFSRSSKSVNVKTPSIHDSPQPHTPPLMTHPVPSQLDSTFDKAATNFPSHVRASFRRAPSDRTGEFVRLLDDISTITHSISSYIAEQDCAIQTTDFDSQTSTLDPEVATRKLYTSLCHDGYACAILERRTEIPLTFPETALNGAYVVMLSSLDVDPTATDHIACGTIFSVYKRKSQPSLPGRLRDLQQKTADQIAAGYVLYSSATTLTYTMGLGAFSFVLHPVATQYFLQPNSAVTLPTGGKNLHIDDEKPQQDQRIRAAANDLCKQRNGTKLNSGCLIADYNAACLSGSLFVRHGIHLLCEAAPLAFLTEQLGGKATDGFGKRILDLCVEDEDVHRKVNFCAGPHEFVEALEASIGASSNPTN